MDDNILKTCVVCSNEKSIDAFCNKYREFKQCNIKMVLKWYFDNKDGILENERFKYARFEDLDKKIKALEEKFTKNDSKFI